MRKILTFILISISISCTNDHEDDLLIPVAPVDPNEPIALKTYNNDVKIIIDNNCVACHANGASASFYPLENYAQVKASAESGKLYGRMTDAVNPMPASGILPGTVTQIIEDWINDGLLEE
jgi:cytochrome c5